MINEISVTAGWQIINTEVIDGAYLVTIKMTSCEPDFEEELHAQMHEDKVDHTHLKSITADLFTFDHDPTTAEIEAALDERGFNPVIARE